VKFGGSLPFSGHVLLEFMTLRDASRANGVGKILNRKKVNFQFCKEIVDWTPWESTLRDKGVKETWQLCKYIILRAQELFILLCRNQARKTGDQHD